MTDQEIEEGRLRVEQDRLELEKARAKLENRFINRHSGALIPAAVALAAVIVSSAQVWVTKVSKDRELEITSIQKRLELDLQDKQKEKELTLFELQKKREWDLSVARFLAENRKAIFHGTPREREVFAQVIPTIFPAEVSSRLLRKIERFSPPASKRVWQAALTGLDQTPSVAGLGGPLKQISSFTYIASRGTEVQVEVKPVGVSSMYSAAIDGMSVGGNPFTVSFSRPEGTSVFLLMDFQFPAGADGQAEYHIILKGSGGGVYQSSVSKTDAVHQQQFQFLIE